MVKKVVNIYKGKSQFELSHLAGYKTTLIYYCSKEIFRRKID